MSRFALVQHGRVAELFDEDLLGNGILVDVTTVVGIEPGWVEGENGTFAAPVVSLPTAEELAVYANMKQWALATGGFTISLSGLPRTFSTDDISRGLMTGKFVRLTQPNPPTTMNWQFATGFAPLVAADFVKAALAVEDFFQATFDALDGVIAAIAAGTTTTTAQVDAAPWPSAIAI